MFAASFQRAGDQVLLDVQQLQGGPAPLPPGAVGDHADRPLLEEPVRQPFQRAAVGADQLVAEGGDHFGTREGGGLRGQPLRAGEPIEYPSDRHLVRGRVGAQPVAAGGCLAGCLPAAAKHLAQQLRDVHTVLGGLGAPPLRQRGGRLLPLGLPRGMDRPLDQLGRSHPPFGLQPLHLAVDRVRPLRERLEEVIRHAGQLAVAPPIRLTPGDPQRPGQGALVGAPVDRVRRQPMPVQVATIKRRPATIRTLHPVRHDHMGVQQGVPGAAGAVVEPDRD